MTTRVLRPTTTVHGVTRRGRSAPRSTVGNFNRRLRLKPILETTTEYTQLHYTKGLRVRSK